MCILNPFEVKGSQYLELYPQVTPFTLQITSRLSFLIVDSELSYACS